MKALAAVMLCGCIVTPVFGQTNAIKILQHPDRIDRWSGCRNFSGSVPPLTATITRVIDAGTFTVSVSDGDPGPSFTICVNATNLLPPDPPGAKNLKVAEVIVRDSSQSPPQEVFRCDVVLDSPYYARADRGSAGGWVGGEICVYEWPTYSDGSYVPLQVTTVEVAPGYRFVGWVGDPVDRGYVLNPTSTAPLMVIPQYHIEVHRQFYVKAMFARINQPPVAVCRDVLIAVEADGYVDASVDGGSYDPDGDSIVCSQIPPGPYPAGVYDVELTVTDPYGASDSCRAMLVVYDPSGGFVTGGGWILSPAGAYKPDPSLAGKANFGFVSKYHKGASTPIGQTEFVFQAGDLNFHSSSYEWLVVTGSTHARFKGSGTINGSGEHRFMLWAGDGPDTFRIRIWTEDEAGLETAVYDNGSDMPICDGSIVIHTK